MRKLLLSVVASCALVAFVPATAVAKRHHHHSRVHHARVHHKTFGSDWTQSGSSTSGSTSSDGTAGTVQSFSGGVLTILLANGGSTVSGQVTNATEIECKAPEPTGMHSHDQGDDNGGGDDQGDNNQGDDDQGQGDDEPGGQSCDSSNLTHGAVVREAELNLSSAGAVWQKLELVTQSTSSSSSGGD